MSRRLAHADGTRLGRTAAENREGLGAKTKSGVSQRPDAKVLGSPVVLKKKKRHDRGSEKGRVNWETKEKGTSRRPR